MLENIYPKNWQETRGIYTPAKKIDLGNCYLLFISGQQAKKNENNEVYTEDIKLQTESVFEQLNEILISANASMKDVVKAQIFLTDMNDRSIVSKIRDKWFSESKPVSTMIEVKGMTRKGAKVEIELTAIINK